MEAFIFVTGGGALFITSLSRCDGEISVIDVTAHFVEFLKCERVVLEGIYFVSKSKASFNMLEPL